MQSLIKAQLFNNGRCKMPFTLNYEEKFGMNLIWMVSKDASP